MLRYTLAVQLSITVSTVFLYSRDSVINRAVQDIALEAIQADNRAFDAFDTTRRYIHSMSGGIIAKLPAQKAPTQFDWQADRVA